MAKHLKLIAVIIMAAILPAVLVCLSSTGHQSSGDAPVMAESPAAPSGPEPASAQTSVPELIFCDVGNRAHYELYKDHVWMERIDLDGYKMNFSRKALEPLIDVDAVYDVRRPPMEK